MTSFSYGMKGLYRNSIDASGQRTVTSAALRTITRKGTVGANTVLNPTTSPGFNAVTGATPPSQKISPTVSFKRELTETELKDQQESRTFKVKV